MADHNDLACNIRDRVHQNLSFQYHAIITTIILVCTFNPSELCSLNIRRHFNDHHDKSYHMPPFRRVDGCQDFTVAQRYPCITTFIGASSYAALRYWGNEYTNARCRVLLQHDNWITTTNALKRKEHISRVSSFSSSLHALASTEGPFDNLCQRRVLDRVPNTIARSNNIPVRR